MTSPDERAAIRAGVANRDAHASLQAFFESLIAHDTEERELPSEINQQFRTSDGRDAQLRLGSATAANSIESLSGDWAVISVEDSERWIALIFESQVLFSEQALAGLLQVGESIRIESIEPLPYDRERSLVLAGGEPTTLDPALTHFGASGLIGDIFSGLVVLGPDMRVRPALAQNWEVSADGLVYTFRLDLSARFHNGRPVTTDDVIFSWKRAAHPDLGSETVMLYMGDIVGLEEYHAGEAADIRGVTRINERMLQVRIDAPKAYFLAKLTYPVSWIVDRYNVIFHDWDAHPNGTGPFRVTQHLEEQIYVLEPHPWSGEQTSIESLVYLVYAGYSQRLYESGEVDYTRIARDQLGRALAPEDGLYGTVVVEGALCTSYVSFNTSMPPFDDALVRRAFSHAVDRERYVEAITNGEATVAGGLLPPGMPGYTSDLEGLRYDPGLAQDLLAQSVYYQGSEPAPSIVWTLASSSGRVSPAAAILVDMWEQNLGVEITIEGIDWESYFRRVDEGQYGQLLMEGWCADYPDPENFLDVLFHSQSRQNHAYYADDAYDAIIERARTEVDINTRLALYRRAMEHLKDDAPALVLSHSGPSYGVWKPYVRGYVPTSIGVPQHHLLWIER
jgi:oligopeptide transport system substrate-binding protein